MKIRNLLDGQHHFYKGGLNANHLLRHAQANSNWLVSVKIGNKTRTLLEWLGKISDVHLAKFCSYSASAITRKRNELEIPYFSGYARDITAEIISVRHERIRKSMYLWATKRPKGLEEYIREITWNKLLEQYGETE